MHNTKGDWLELHLAFFFAASSNVQQSLKAAARVVRNSSPNIPLSQLQSQTRTAEQSNQKKNSQMKIGFWRMLDLIRGLVLDDERRSTRGVKWVITFPFHVSYDTFFLSTCEFLMRDCASQVLYFSASDFLLFRKVIFLKLVTHFVLLADLRNIMTQCCHTSLFWWTRFCQRR